MYSPKLNWIKFNEMFLNKIIEPNTNMNSNSTSNYPINIKESYVDDDNKNCSAKCSFSFKYPSGSLILKNMGEYLELDYENGSTSPVIFNAEKYKVHKIYIFNQSLHYFEGMSTTGEILIYHTSLEGAIPLIVSIPISNSSSAGSKLGTSSLENVIGIAYENTPKSDDSIILNTESFTLNDYFPPPGTPFYTYKGENFLNTSHFTAEEVHYIVYEHNNGVLLTDNNGMINKLNTLFPTATTSLFTNEKKTIAEDNADDTELKKKIFINKNGASLFEGDDDIYIDCSPTGDSDNEVAFNLKANSITGGLTSQKYDFMVSVVTKFSISIIIILCIWYAPYYVTDLLNGKDIMKKLENMSFGTDILASEKKIKDLDRKLIKEQPGSPAYIKIKDELDKERKIQYNRRDMMKDTTLDRGNFLNDLKDGFSSGFPDKARNIENMRDGIASLSNDFGTYLNRDSTPGMTAKITTNKNKIKIQRDRAKNNIFPTYTKKKSHQTSGN